MENMLMHSTDDDISFHYEAYRIIGDTAEIDDIIKSEGFINLCGVLKNIDGSEGLRL